MQETEPEDDERIIKLDARGLICPEPVILTRNKLRKATPGTTLVLVATDPSTIRDIPLLCKYLGYSLLEEQRFADEFIYTIGVKESRLQ